ncbi:hypothetical protein BWQ96_03153 [Gracilariopsis chorda]|uniref:Uncharacterized protein n=1 Tax=Gracilariopsis chorda TaxID=448386 RepID=A0A2V3IY45_9FLOR|nr:hypothetical protein BWQ96_03153 [Gracilariopsis chorda]|eukprot:PXF47076.1 hypothetical protein BWQ96_03153 [Gracilariopsis chorda]
MTLLCATEISGRTYGTFFKAAAECVARQNLCDSHVAKSSIHCKEDTFVKKQSRSCRNAACKYCTWPSSTNDNACYSWAIRHWCASFPGVQNGQTLKPGRMPHKDPYRCVWHGRDKELVLDLKFFTAWGGWTQNGDGLEWKRYLSKGIDEPGSGEMCFKFAVPEDGFYYFTALTSAPHPTDHNDMWVRIQTGIRLYRGKTHVYWMTVRKYIKAYQNLGENRINDILSSVDHNPHYFVSEKLMQNETHTVCISGRSSRFTVYKLVFVKCSPTNGSCNRWGRYIREKMNSLVEPICK